MLLAASCGGGTDNDTSPEPFPPAPTELAQPAPVPDTTAPAATTTTPEAVTDPTEVPGTTAAPTVTTAPTPSTTEPEPGTVTTDAHVPPEWLPTAVLVSEMAACANQANLLVAAAESAIDEEDSLSDQIAAITDFTNDTTDTLECMYLKASEAMGAAVDTGLCDSRADELADAQLLLAGMVNQLRPTTDELLHLFEHLGELLDALALVADTDDEAMQDELEAETTALLQQIDTLGSTLEAPLAQDVPWAYTETAWLWQDPVSETFHTYTTAAEVQQFCGAN